MKKIILCFLVLLFFISIIFNNSFVLSKRSILNDLNTSLDLINIYSVKYSRESLLEYVKLKKMNEVEKKTALYIYECLQDENIYIYYDEILRNYSYNSGGVGVEVESIESYKNIDANLVLYIDDVDKKINLIELKNKKYICYNNQYIKIVDIFNILCYNNIERSVNNNFIFDSYIVKNNKLVVKYINNSMNKTIEFVFTHKLFGILDTIEVLV